MIRKIIIALGLLVLVLGVLIGMFLNWANNPYGLEPERIGPKGTEELPQIIPTPNAKNYLLYSKYENNSYVIHLPLPNEYIHPSNTTNRISKTYAVAATLYYPEINGKYHPDNANLPECNGYCGGYMRIFIEPGKNAKDINNGTVQRLQNDKLKNGDLRLFEDLDGEFGIDEHFQIRFPVLEEKSNGNRYATNEYFIKRDRFGEMIHLFECSPYTPSPACKVNFNLTSHPELLVHVTFGRHLMAEWEKLITATDNKISRWGLKRVNAIVK